MIVLDHRGEGYTLAAVNDVMRHDTDSRQEGATIVR